MQDKQAALTNAARLDQILELQEDRWSDPYQLSKKLRNTFRADKKERKIRDASDSDLKAKFGLPDALKLEDDTVESRDAAHQEWLREKAKRSGSEAETERKRKRLAIEMSSLASVPALPPAPVASSSSSTARSHGSKPSSKHRSERHKHSIQPSLGTLKQAKTSSAASLLSGKLASATRHAKDPFLHSQSTRSGLGDSLGVKRKA